MEHEKEELNQLKDEEGRIYIYERYAISWNIVRKRNTAKNKSKRVTNN